MTVTPFAPIINSLLDTDLYKFTMQQVVLHQMPGTRAKYVFRCRNLPTYPLSELMQDVELQLDHLCSLRFKQEELDYLRTLRFLKSDYVDFLEGFQLKRRFIQVSVGAEGGLEIEVPEYVPMLHGMMFEIYTLAIVNELYFRRLETPATRLEAVSRLNSKVELVREYFDHPDNRRANPFEFFDFGTRRRFSRDWQEKVVSHLASRLSTTFRGTSNVDLARRLGLTPIGSMAHEYLQAFQAMNVRLRDFQKAALEAWVQEYRGDLDIALTDVVGMRAFMRDFDRYFAKLFDGLRHDSGDPYSWGETAISKYTAHKIATADKRLVFSDGLDIPISLALYNHFADRVQTGFGIGTNLTNDTGITPLNIVMKMVRCNGQSVAKISDSPGKTMSTDETYLRYLRETFEIEAR